MGRGRIRALPLPAEPLYTAPCTRCPSGGIGRRSGLRPCELSPRGEIPGVKPVKLGEGPEQSRLPRANTEPSPDARCGGKV